LFLLTTIVKISCMRVGESLILIRNAGGNCIVCIGRTAAVSATSMAKCVTSPLVEKKSIADQEASLT
jgi:hypothetical protein